MIKALKFLSGQKKSLNEDHLLVGDNDFLYLSYPMNQARLNPLLFVLQEIHI